MPTGAGVVYSALALVGNVLAICLIARSVLSFFPPPGRLSPLNGLISLLYSLTEPVLRPIRRLLPSTGGIDFSPLVALLGIWVILQILSNLLLA